MAQILINSRMCAEGHRPMCQDTGIVTVFVKVGMNVRWDATLGLEDMVNEGVRRAYNRSGQQAARLASWPTRPASARTPRTTRPAVINVSIVPGRHGRRDRRGQGRRLGGQVAIRHAQPVRLDRRLGAEDRADHGRRLVPAGHARHRHRRHRREGDAAGQGIADGADRHPGADRARPVRIGSKSCASSCTTRSTRWASARRAWAA